MAPLPPPQDPTLDAADRALEVLETRRPRRRYLGMSALGQSCSRRLWYDYHAPSQGAAFDAATLKRFADGHASEDVMANRLRLVPGLTLLTIDPETGRQWGFSDLDDRLKGHMDGAVAGLMQAPKAWHVWEGKCTNEKSFLAFVKLRNADEKTALAKWNPTYYAQAVLYMHYSGMDRHYLTVCTPGARDWASARTEADPGEAIRLVEKARRILDATVPLARISNDPAWHECRYCQHHEVCHGG